MVPDRRTMPATASMTARGTMLEIETVLAKRESANNGNIDSMQNVEPRQQNR